MTKYYCKDCGKEIYYGSIRCKSCSRKYQYKIRPESNPQYGKKGKLSTRWDGGWKHYCLDCGKKIDFDAKRCKKHARIYQYKHHPESHPFKGKHHDKDTLIKISKSSKKMWNIEGNRTRIIKAQRKGMQIYPNKPEKIIKKLLNKLSKDYKYVGNGSFIIEGFNPDFMNINGKKKLIEIFGSYWHKRPEVIERDRRRIRAYKKYGYDSLIIWEHELKNTNRLTHKLERFI